MEKEEVKENKKETKEILAGYFKEIHEILEKTEKNADIKNFKEYTDYDFYRIVLKSGSYEEYLRNIRIYELLSSLFSVKKRKSWNKDKLEIRILGLKFTFTRIKEKLEYK